MNWFQLIIWFAVGIVALGIDILTSSLLFIWFTAGAIGAIICLTLGFSFSTQLIVFIALSILLIITGYPVVRKNIKQTVPKTKTMEQQYIGREIIAIKNIEERELIKIDGIYWTVENKGQIIRRGDKFKIIDIEGNKLLIEKL